MASYLSLKQEKLERCLYPRGGGEAYNQMFFLFTGRQTYNLANKGQFTAKEFLF